MSEQETERKRIPGTVLVKRMLEAAPAMLTDTTPITQDRMAEAIGCHRHWFRRHVAKYDPLSGQSLANGLTVLQILDLLEVDRQRRQKKGGLSSTEQALVNAQLDIARKAQTIKALEGQLAEMRRCLHLIALNRARLGIDEKELFREPS